MTRKELMEFCTKIRERILVLEEAAAILADEPFASNEPDNAEFCDGLEMRIEKMRMMAESLEQEIESMKS